MSGADSFFVDSNLLWYFVDPEDDWKQARVAEWLNALWSSGAGRLSWQALNEFYWNVVRKMRMHQAKAREIVEDLSYWGPVCASMGIVQEAWHWMDAAQVTYWEAMTLAAARRSGARYLLSEDFQSGRKYEDVQVLNPFEHSPADFSL